MARCTNCQRVTKETLFPQDEWKKGTENDPLLTLRPDHAKVRERCRVISQLEDEWPENWILISQSKRSLIVSGITRCELCAFLASSILAWAKSPVYKFRTDNKFRDAVGIAVGRRVANFRLLIVPMGIIIPYDRVTDRPFKKLNLLPYWESRQPHLDVASEWINSCARGHAFCQPKLKIPETELEVPKPEQKLSGATDWFCPPRLLDVLPENNKDLVCLRSREHLLQKKKRVEYLALSYCWGSMNQEHVTTPSNLGQRMKYFLLKSLPRTLQDAVLVARGMGCGYIWIDALCILQGHRGAQLTREDGDTDWDEHVGLMGLIYSHALCTVVASSATDCHAGLWQDIGRQSAAYSQIKADECRIRSAKDAHGMNFSWPRQLISPNSILTGPLMRRAWAFQEYLLSTRRLFITNSGMFWQCQSDTLSELFPDRDPCYSQYEIPQLKRQLGSFGHQLEYWTEVHQSDWEALVTNYSALQLTYYSDALPALAGLARLIGESSGARVDHYVAGHWRSHLPASLAWSRARLPPSSVSVPTAVSWSWASLHQEGVTWSHHNFEPEYQGLGSLLSRVWIEDFGSQVYETYDNDNTIDIFSDNEPLSAPRWNGRIEIVNISVRLSGSDPFGAVDSARITLKGLVGTINSSDMLIMRQKPDKFSWECIDKPRAVMDWQIPDEELQYTWILVARKPCMQQARQNALFTLAVDRFAAILLQSVDSERDTYRRVGLLVSAFPHRDFVSGVMRSIDIV